MSRLFRPFLLGVLFILPLMACTLTTTAPVSATPTAPPVQIVTATPGPATATPTATVTPLPPTQRPATSIPLYNLRQPIPAPSCGVQPVDGPVNIRSGPGTNFPVIGILPLANWSLASRLNSGWYQISALNTPVNGGWVAASVTTLNQPCQCSANSCTVSQPPPLTPIPPPVTAQPPYACSMSVLTMNDIVGTYDQPSVSSNPGLTLMLGSWVDVVGRTADGWYAFDYYGGRAPLSGIFRLDYVQTSARITLVGAACGTLKTLDLSYPAPAACSVTPQNVSSIPVYGSPTFDIGPVGNLNSGAELIAIGQTAAGVGGAANGWYAVEMNPPPANQVGIYGLRWVPIDGNVTLVGNCGIAGLPTLNVEY
ncbi:MAG: SH3 domain-containing protein [Anaerolineae bacterium]|nr:SH3 domain-containing protein [Anaerolineae bacterium]